MYGVKWSGLLSAQQAIVGEGASAADGMFSYRGRGGARYAPPMGSGIEGSSSAGGAIPLGAGGVGGVELLVVAQLDNPVPGSDPPWASAAGQAISASSPVPIRNTPRLDMTYLPQSQSGQRGKRKTCRRTGGLPRSAGEADQAEINDYSSCSVNRSTEIEFLFKSFSRLFPAALTPAGWVGLMRRGQGRDEGEAKEAVGGIDGTGAIDIASSGVTACPRWSGTGPGPRHQAAPRRRMVSGGRPRLRPRALSGGPVRPRAGDYTQPGCAACTRTAACATR